MAQITVKIHVTERNALFELAQREYRRPQEQAALIIRTELERRGLLPNERKIETTAVTEGATNDQQ